MVKAAHEKNLHLGENLRKSVSKTVEQKREGPGRKVGWAKKLERRKNLPRRLHTIRDSNQAHTHLQVDRERGPSLVQVSIRGRQRQKRRGKRDHETHGHFLPEGG